MQSLVGLAEIAGLWHVHSDTKRAPVNLGDSDLDEFQERVLQAGFSSHEGGESPHGLHAFGACGSDVETLVQDFLLKEQIQNRFEMVLAKDPKKKFLNRPLLFGRVRRESLLNQTIEVIALPTIVAYERGSRNSLARLQGVLQQNLPPQDREAEGHAPNPTSTSWGSSPPPSRADGITEAAYSVARKPRFELSAS